MSSWLRASLGNGRGAGSPMGRPEGPSPVWADPPGLTFLKGLLRGPILAMGLSPHGSRGRPAEEVSPQPTAQNSNGDSLAIPRQGSARESAEPRESPELVFAFSAGLQNDRGRSRLSGSDGRSGGFGGGRNRHGYLERRRKKAVQELEAAASSMREFVKDARRASEEAEGASPPKRSLITRDEFEVAQHGVVKPSGAPMEQSNVQTDGPSSGAVIDAGLSMAEVTPMVQQSRIRQVNQAMGVNQQGASSNQWGAINQPSASSNQWGAINQPSAGSNQWGAINQKSASSNQAVAMANQMSPVNGPGVHNQAGQCNLGTMAMGSAASGQGGLQQDEDPSASGLLEPVMLLGPSSNLQSTVLASGLQILQARADCRSSEGPGRHGSAFHVVAADVQTPQQGVLVQSGEAAGNLMFMLVPIQKVQGFDASKLPSGVKCGTAELGAVGHPGCSMGLAVAAEDLHLGGVQSHGQCRAEGDPRSGTGKDLAVGGLSCGVVAGAGHVSDGAEAGVSGLGTRQLPGADHHLGQCAVKCKRVVGSCCCCCRKPAGPELKDEHDFKKGSTAELGEPRGQPQPSGTQLGPGPTAGSGLEESSQGIVLQGQCPAPGARGIPGGLPGEDTQGVAWPEQHPAGDIVGLSDPSEVCLSGAVPVSWTGLRCESCFSLSANVFSPP